jgi:hypothetical protein
MKLCPLGFDEPAQDPLPAVFVEKVKILPTDFTNDEQPIEITLSLQKVGRSNLAWESLYKHPYRVFAGVCHSEDSIIKMENNDLLVKDLIRNPNKALGKKGRLKKFYLAPPPLPQKAQSMRRYPSAQLRPSILVNAPEKFRSPIEGLGALKKSITFTYRCPIKSSSRIYVYAVAYGVDLQSVSTSGVDRKIKAMRTGLAVSETIMLPGPMGEGWSSAAARIFRVDAPGYQKQIWTGRTALLGDNKLVGIPAPGSDYPSPLPLVVETVSNQKIIDLRFLDSLNSLQFTNSENKGQVLSPRERKDLEKAAKVVKLPSKVSDCKFSRTPSNALKIFFELDYGRLVRENSQLGHLFQNEDALASCYRIENIRIYRTRIKANVQPNALTPGKMNICGSSVREPGNTEKLVASLGNGGLRQVGVQGLSSDSGILMAFVATDEDIKSHGTGMYEYRAIFDMTDLTATAVQNSISELRRFLSYYNKFLAAADRNGQKGVDIKAMLKRDSIKLKALNEQWARLINSFLTSVEFIFGDIAFERFPLLSWHKNLLAMTNPMNGDIGEMRRVAEIIEGFTSNLSQALRPPTAPTSATTTNNKSKVQAQNSAKRKIVLEHVFRTNWEQPGSANEGSDYLDVTQVFEDDTFTWMPQEGFLTRLDGEVTKYAVPNTNDPGINKFGFLSPRRLNTKGSVIETSTRSLEQELGNGILNTALSPNTSRFSNPFITSNENPVVAVGEIDDLLSYGGLSVQPLAQPLREILKSPKPLTDKTFVSTDYLPAESPFVHPDVTAEAQVSGSAMTDAQIMKLASRKTEIKGSEVVKHLIGAQAIGFREPATFDAPDVAVGSLAAEAAVQAPGSVNLNTSFGNAVNFNSLVQIQFFNGYHVTDGIINLNAPRWETLRRPEFLQAMATVADTGTPLLCRLVRINKTLDEPNHYVLPPYDTLFTLGSSAQMSDSTSAQLGEGDWEDYVDNLYAKRKNSMKLPILNLESAAASVDGSYLRVRRPSRRRRGEEDSSSTPTEGASY